MVRLAVGAGSSSRTVHSRQTLTKPTCSRLPSDALSLARRVRACSSCSRLSTCRAALRLHECRRGTTRQTSALQAFERWIITLARCDVTSLSRMSACDARSCLHEGVCVMVRRAGARMTNATSFWQHERERRLVHPASRSEIRCRVLVVDILLRDETQSEAAYSDLNDTGMSMLAPPPSGGTN